MLKKRYYVSGQISNLPLEKAKEIFNDAVEYLKSQGCDALNPFDIDPCCDKPEWVDYMKADIKGMLDCDGVYALENHINSRGATIEINLALSLGMEVIYQDLSISVKTGYETVPA